VLESPARGPSLELCWSEVVIPARDYLGQTQSEGGRRKEETREEGMKGAQEWKVMLPSLEPRGEVRRKRLRAVRGRADWRVSSQNSVEKSKLVVGIWKENKSGRLEKSLRSETRDRDKASGETRWQRLKGDRGQPETVTVQQYNTRSLRWNKRETITSIMRYTNKREAHREIVQKLCNFLTFLSSKAHKFKSWDLVILKMTMK
jgi:hypothetical protein